MAKRDFQTRLSLHAYGQYQSIFHPHASALSKIRRARMCCISEQRHHSIAPRRQRREVARAVFQDSGFIRRIDEIRNRVVPSVKHLLELAFPSAGGVEMVRRHIGCRIPRERAVTGVENSESLSSAPRFAVATDGNRIAIVLRQAAPDRVTAIDGIGSAEQL